MRAGNASVAIREISRRFAPDISVLCAPLSRSPVGLALFAKYILTRLFNDRGLSHGDNGNILCRISRKLTTVKSTVLGHEIREFEYFRARQCIINVCRIGGTDRCMLVQTQCNQCDILVLSLKFHLYFVTYHLHIYMY